MKSLRKIRWRIPLTVMRIIPPNITQLKKRVEIWTTGTNVEPRVRTGMLDRMPYLVSSYRCDSNRIGIVNVFAQVDRSIERIVIVRQHSGSGNHLDIREGYDRGAFIQQLPSRYRNLDF
jgi:hypothetical protein